MARASETTAISFGMVAVPVKLYTATKSGERVSFRTMCPSCDDRVRNLKHCPSCDEVVEATRKGWEHTKGEYLILSEDDLDALEAPDHPDGIEIVEFLPTGAVPQSYVGKTYYVGPGKGGSRPYSLLAKSLEKAGRVAVAKHYSRGKMTPVRIRGVDGRLHLDQLAFSNAVRAESEVPVDTAEVSDDEVEFALKLIEKSATDEWDPEKYRDEEYERKLGLLNELVEGRELSIPSIAPKAESQPDDLMASLKASLEVA